jgi:predicted patatin/cPLA2 family phospholipase
LSSSHPVSQVLYQRRNEGSLPGARTDNYRVGLVVEGGGMRGLISGAMMATLLDRGLEHSFDAIYTFSAGALNSVYFLSGLGWYAVAIYYDHLACRAFFDMGRILRGQPALSLDYAIDVVVEATRPLDYTAVLASPIELHVVTSSIRELRPRVFAHFASKEDLKTILKATCCIPVAAGAPIAYNGDHFLDGGVLLAHPILPALEDRCTHILYIRTRVNTPFRFITSLGQHMMARYLQHLHSGLGTAYLDTVKQRQQLYLHFQSLSQRQGMPPFILEAACPAGTHHITRFTRDRGVLLQGLRTGYNAMVEALDGENCTEHVYLRPTLFSHSS